MKETDDVREMEKFIEDNASSCDYDTLLRAWQYDEKIEAMMTAIEDKLENVADDGYIVFKRSRLPSYVNNEEMKEWYERYAYEDGGQAWTDNESEKVEIDSVESLLDFMVKIGHVKKEGQE